MSIDDQITKYLQDPLSFPPEYKSWAVKYLEVHQPSLQAGLLAGKLPTSKLTGSVPYSQLTLANSIVNADINTAAAIAASKLAGYPTDASKVLLGDGSWAGADIKLFNSTLGADAANIDIPTISQAYAHLELWILARTATVAALDLLLIRFNADTAGNYDWQDTVGSGTTVATAESLAATTCRIGVVPGANPGANLFGLAVVKIPHYTGGKEKIYTAESGSKTGTATGNLRRDSIEGSWRSTAAITQITILAAANLIAGSRATLYGKGA